MTHVELRTCTVCDGTGQVDLEDASGLPTRRVTCGYCQGRGTNAWVNENRDAFYARNRRRLHWFYGYTVFVVVNACLHFVPYPPGIWTGLVVLAVPAMGLWCLANPTKPKAASQHAPGFDTDREKNALGLFTATMVVGGLVEKYFRDSHKNRSQGL